MVTESGRGLRGPVWPSGSQPFMLAKNHRIRFMTDEGVDYSHFDLDSKDTLAQKYVAHSVVDEITSRLTRVDHEAIGELHGFSTGSTELARNNDLTTLGTGLHDESEHTVAST